MGAPAIDAVSLHKKMLEVDRTGLASMNSIFDWALQRIERDGRRVPASSVTQKDLIEGFNFTNAVHKSDFVETVQFGEFVLEDTLPMHAEDRRIFNTMRRNFPVTSGENARVAVTAIINSVIERLNADDDLSPISSVPTTPSNHPSICSPSISGPSNHTHPYEANLNSSTPLEATCLPNSTAAAGKDGAYNTDKATETPFAQRFTDRATLAGVSSNRKNWLSPVMPT